MRHSEKDSLLLSGKRWPEELRTGLSLFVMTALAWTFPVSAQDSDELQSSDEESYEEEVIVTGLRGTMQSAQSIKYDAATLVDSIVADDIANLPDRSVTETLQRVPGVTIDRFISRGDPEHPGGEGTGVAVRGLTQVRGEINGRDGFTANGGRSLSFEDVPPELLAGVDVYKNQTADMIEGGLGGTVNLRTRMPFDIDGQLIGLTATANYQNFIEETTPGFSAIYSNRWDTGGGEMGFLVDLAYSELKGRIDVLFSRPYFPRNEMIGNPGEEGSFEIPGTTGTVWVPRGADWRTERTERERKGGYVAFQWQPNDDMEYNATVFRSEYNFLWDEDALFVDNNPFGIWPEPGPNGSDDGDWTYDENGVFQTGTVHGWEFVDTDDPQDGVRDTWNEIGIPFGSDVRVATRDSVTTDVSQGFEWQIDSNWLFTTELQYVKATTEGLDSTIGAGISVPEAYLDMTGKYPEIQIDPILLSNPDNYYIGFTMDHQDDNEAEQYALRADMEYAFDMSEGLRSLKFGVRYADTEQTLINTGYNWRAVIQPWMRWWALSGMDPLPNIADIGLGDFVTVNTFDDFYRGDIPALGSVVALQRSIALGYPQTYYDIHNGALPYYLCCFFTEPTPGNRVTNFTPTLIEDIHRNIQDQSVTSAYMMLRFGWDDIGLDGNVGVRFVDTENTATGYILYPDTSSFPVEIQQLFPDEPIFVSVDNSYRNTLPSLNLRYKFTDELIGRFAYSKAIARPNFSDMQAYIQLFLNLNTGAPNGSTNINDYNGSATGGNPWLEPMEADQFDLSLEWYYSDIGSAWLNLFKKDIDKFIRVGRVPQDFSDVEFVIQAPANQDKADIDGWELGWRQFWNSGFGIEVAYTSIDASTEVTEQTIPVDTDGTPYNPDALPYEGLSETSYSTTFMFENQLVSARLAYTWREEFMLSIGPNGFNGNFEGVNWQLPVFQEDYGQWDGSVFFNINDIFAVGLEANNLTNEEIVLHGRQLNSPGGKSFAVQDTRYALTLRAKW